MKTIFLKIFIVFISTLTLCSANEINIVNEDSNKVECKISKLDDDNKRDIIVCKYIQTRVNHDKEIFVEWINPRGEVDRARKLSIPAGHGSVYDYRYLAGRTKGIWKFIATDNTNKYKTSFEVK